MDAAQEPDKSVKWMIAAMALVIVIALALRLGTNILTMGVRFDEQYIRVPIEDLINHGWSVKTAIDFKESKGPGFVWPYAIAGEVVGSALNDLRLITVLFFITGVIPLLLIARRCGLAGPMLIGVGALYALIPQNAVLGQLLMSEPSFICGGLWLMWAFLWGFGENSAREKRIAGPIVFSILLAVLLHNRIHAVAFAGAAALVAFERDRWRSWPWWLVCVLAGLARIPLWIRWGGLVSPEYAELHALGLRLDSLTYLAAALAPYTALLLWPAMREPACKPYRWMCAAGAVVGLILVIIAPVHLDRTLFLEIEGDRGERPVYQGMAASLCSALPGSAASFLAISTMCVIGLASLGALAAIAFSQSIRVPLGQAYRLQMWTFLSGWCMYAMTSGYVFDRFIMAWAVLMPIVWARALPKWLLAVQMIAMTGVLAQQVVMYLI